MLNTFSFASDVFGSNKRDEYNEKKYRGIHCNNGASSCHNETKVNKCDMYSSLRRNQVLYFNVTTSVNIEYGI